MRTAFSARLLQARLLRARGLAGIPVLGLALVLSTGALAGCSPDASAPSASSAPAGAIASHVGVTAPPELSTTTEIGRIVGRLPGTRRKAVRQEVTRVIDRWWEAAYLFGAGPTTEASAAFPGFTAGARKRAVFDRDLTTNAELEGAAITPLMRKVRLDLLAVNQRARSVTARFDLRVRVAGEPRRRLRMHGRLFLTHQAQGWRVFGYDVSKGWL